MAQKPIVPAEGEALQRLIEQLEKDTQAELDEAANWRLHVHIADTVAAESAKRSEAHHRTLALVYHNIVRQLKALAPLAGPVDASGEPDLRRLIAEWRSHAADSRSQLAKAFKDALVICADELEAAIAAAVPSSPAQKPRLTDLQRICNLNVMQAMAVQQYIERLALPPSSPVAGSPTLDDVRIVLRQFEMRAYRADALPPGNHRLKPTLTEWREMAQWLYDTLRRAVPTLAESGEVNAGHR